MTEEEAGLEDTTLGLILGRSISLFTGEAEEDFAPPSATNCVICDAI
jgi:hypothetical protein